MLEIWTVYEHPRDYPNNFVARKFLFDKPTDEILICDNLDVLRKAIQRASPIILTRIDRSPDDNPVVVESWL